jgi:ABC-type uncharacterized transport system ATPase subunit
MTVSIGGHCICTIHRWISDIFLLTSRIMTLAKGELIYKDSLRYFA